MQKEFSLESILTVTTGIVCTDNYDDVFELAYFVFSDETINYWVLDKVSDYFRDHLLNIHPELKRVVPPRKMNNDMLNIWIYEQKNIYGETLPVCKFGRKLANNFNTKNRAK